MPEDQVREEELQDETSLKDSISDLTGNIRDYLETYYRLSIVKVTQKATNIASKALVMLTLCTLGIFVLLFASIGGAFWLGDAIGSTGGGFMLVAAFYLVVVVCIIAMRKRIVFPYIRNLIIRTIYE